MSDSDPLGQSLIRKCQTLAKKTWQGQTLQLI